MNDDKVLEALCSVSAIINLVWNALDKEQKEEFKIALTISVADSNSPIWRGKP